MNSKFLLLLFLICSTTYGQSWQWGKRGGAVEALTITNTQGQEETYSLVTDNNKLVYGLSRVGSTGLDVDNVSKTNFDGGSSPDDYALFSFACDGSYRWSKIIGGSGDETVHPLQLDSQNNLIIAGKFGGCTGEAISYPGLINVNINNIPVDINHSLDYPIIINQIDPTQIGTVTVVCTRGVICTEEEFVSGTDLITDFIGSYNFTIEQWDKLKVNDPNLYDYLQAHKYHIIKKVTETGVLYEVVVYKE